MKDRRLVEPVHPISAKTRMPTVLRLQGLISNQQVLNTDGLCCAAACRSAPTSAAMRDGLSRVKGGEPFQTEPRPPPGEGQLVLEVIRPGGPGAVNRYVKP